MSNFAGFGSALATVASAVMSKPKFIYNIAAQNNYASLWYLLNGRKMSDILRAGADVRVRVKFTASSKQGWYNVPSEDHSPQISQDGNWAIAYWCAHMAQESWKEEQLLVNSGGTGEGAVAEETYTQEMFNLLQSLMTQFHYGMTTSLWAKPNNATMNNTDPTRPCSITSIINEFTNGLFVEDATTTWTSVHGLAPATYTTWKPYQLSYGAGDTGFTVASKTNLLYALSLAMRKTTLIPPPMSKEYFDPEDETAVDKSGGVVFASAVGVAKAEQLYRSSQDRWADWMDPAGNPRFKNVQLVHEAQLDSYAGYPDGSGYGTVDETSTAATRGGPRFYGVNAKYMKMYYHRNRFMKFLEPFREGATTYTQHVNTMGTLLCPDRSKHFILYPNGNQT